MPVCSLGRQPERVLESLLYTFKTSLNNSTFELFSPIGNKGGNHVNTFPYARCIVADALTDNLARLPDREGTPNLPIKVIWL